MRDLPGRRCAGAGRSHHRCPDVRAQARLGPFRARRAAQSGRIDEAEAGFKQAVGAFRELQLPFPMAVTLTEHGEWLVAQGRASDAEPLLAEAREIFERLRAMPWLERVDAALPAAAAATS